MTVGRQAACRSHRSRVSVRHGAGEAARILHERERVTLRSKCRKQVQASVVTFFSGAGRFPAACYGPGH